MKFDEFLSSVDLLRTIPLGGQKAQFKLAPALRLDYDEIKIHANQPKRAAVLSLFYPNKENDTCILLTERASYKGTHSAQISFPGGKIDSTDSNLEETALRETFEEIGVRGESIHIVREITDVYIPPSNFLATPFLAYSTVKPNFITNYEVEQTIEIKVSDLLDDTNISEVLMNTSYMDNYPVPCFKLNNYIVWGATGMVLSEIKEMFKQLSF